MTILLWEKDIPGYNPEFGDCIPEITPYILEGGRPRGAVIVCPGGGYHIKAEHEGRPIAEWLNRIGLSAFVLNYRVAPYRHPVPLTDAQRAIRMVRYHALEWNIHPGKIGILGFSAGGHLASTAGTHYDTGNPGAGDPVERMSSRPDAMILCYPVISFGEYGHEGSMKNLLGESPSGALKHSLSNENCVTSGTPPAFIWHTANDGGVHVENSLRFASALRMHQIDFELHVFQDGRHGLGLAEQDPWVSQWTGLCEKWLQKIRFFEE